MQIASVFSVVVYNCVLCRIHAKLEAIKVEAIFVCDVHGLWFDPYEFAV